MNKHQRIAVTLGISVVLGGCATPSSQVVLLGESNAGGADAAQEANIAINNAAGAGCEAISVGGYATGGEGLIIGIPVLVKCPVGTRLLPNGQPAP